jgi:hypothetical protein
MATLQTQYRNFLLENPNLTFDEWISMKFSTPTPVISGGLTPMENEEREIYFCDVLSGITESLTEAKCCNGGISDVGNEVGYAVGKMIENMTQSEINNFILGFLHGISLTNGIH